MAQIVTASGITLENDTFGQPSDPVVLLVMGFTAQMTVWPEEFCTRIASAGRYVIRYDNRDCGLSTKFDGVSVDMGAVMKSMMTGDPASARATAPYVLADMANDGIELLSALGIEKAHIIGASMGGMIVQRMTIDHPERVLTLTSIMSTTGEREYGKSAPEAQAALLTPPPADRAGVIEASVKAHIWASKKYRDVEATKAMAAASYDRSFYPEGASRQMAAILADGSRGEQLRNVNTPTLVIHGLDDTLIMPSGGERTAECIPGAKLMLVEDMGHDLPTPLLPMICDAIITHTA